MEEAAEAREYVRILRRCGFSMTEIAGKIGLSRVSVTLIHCGKQRPRRVIFEILRELALQAAKDARDDVKGFIKGAKRK